MNITPHLQAKTSSNRPKIKRAYIAGEIKYWKKETSKKHTRHEVSRTARKENNLSESL